MIDISDGTKQIWGEDPPLMEVCWTHHKSLSRRHWGDVPGFRGCEVGACWRWGTVKGVRGPRGANICAGLHTHWLHCQPYTKKQLPGLTCVQTIIFPLLLLGVTYLCQTTLIGIVVLKSYNYKCNPDQSNALCTIIRHYIHYMVITITIILLILSPIAKQSGVLNIKQLFLILLHHPPSSSIYHPTPHPSSDCDAKWCV